MNPAGNQLIWKLGIVSGISETTSQMGLESPIFQLKTAQLIPGLNEAQVLYVSMQKEFGERQSDRPSKHDWIYSRSTVPTDKSLKTTCTNLNSSLLLIFLLQVFSCLSE